MTDASEIAREPRWVPHALDMAGGRMQFLRLGREALSRSGFLGEIEAEAAEAQAWLPLDEVRMMEIDTGPLHFIFHTAFCRSTLLVRALESPGVSAGLAEPGILTHLASAGDAARDLAKPVCDLLSRPWSEGEAVFVKPTNHANRVIPALLAARPEAKAVLMTNPLASFLRAVEKRALMGRRWGRQLYLEVMGYAGMDLGMDGREQFSMTDLQAAGLAWFLSQRYFTMLLAGPDGTRLRALDGDRFDGAREETLSALSQFTGLGLPADRIAAIAAGPAFASHAKLGGEFAGEAAARSPSFAQECDQVAQWIAMIAEQAGIAAPIEQTLF